MMNGPENFELVDCPDCGGLAVESGDGGGIECTEPGCDSNFSIDDDD